jgi:hypothetical protein
MKARTTVRAFFMMAKHSGAQAKIVPIITATCAVSLSAGFLDRLGNPHGKRFRHSNSHF